jgi:hypothetical protein
MKNAQEQNFLPLGDHDSYAVMIHKDGRKSRHEFFIGSGYLSQSSRTLQLPSDAKRVVIYDFMGKFREMVIGDR